VNLAVSIFWGWLVFGVGIDPGERSLFRHREELFSLLERICLYCWRESVFTAERICLHCGENLSSLLERICFGRREELFWPQRGAVFAAERSRFRRREERGEAKPPLVGGGFG
jgi:hypothetical protein